MKIENKALNIIDKVSSNVMIEENYPKENNKKNETELLKGQSAAVLAGAKIVRENGYKLNENTINDIKEYLSGDKSEIPAKLNSLKIIIEKNMPIKESLLSKIQLNSEISFLDFLEDFEVNHVNLKNKKTNINSLNNDLHRYKKTINKNQDLLTNILEIIDNTISNQKLKVNNNILKTDSNTINELIDKNTLTVNLLDKNTKKTSPKDDTIIKEIVDNINQKFTNNNLHEDLSELSNYLNLDLNLNNIIVNKEVLEIKVTQKLINLKNEFSKLKNEINLNIDKLSEKNSNLSKSDKQSILYDSIEKLDNTIMKSELNLYIDLKGERELIKISSQLQIAKKYLENGRVKKAEETFKYAKKILDSINFKPSIKKSFAVAANNKIRDNYNLKDVKSFAKEAIDNFVKSDSSVSSLINYLRKIGINNDVEHFQEMINSRDNTKDIEFKNFSNLKEMLLKMNSNIEDSRITQNGNKMIQHIEGNQLKNKIIDSKIPQSVELEIPINLNGRIKSVKVFIKSPQKMLKLDWENFDMYFVLNSDKLGQMGIKVSALQRQLNVKIINDKVKKISTENNLNDDFKNELDSFGYNLVKMVMETWNKDKESNIKKDKKSEKMISDKSNVSENFKIDITV